MWCDLRKMKMNESETKTMIVSRSRTIIHPQSTPLTFNETVLKECADLVILGVHWMLR